MDNSKSLEKYVCVHCGLPVKAIVKQYSPSVLKLVHCGNCQKVADKYIEYDGVIILIDIILFSKQAYRHILFNIGFEKHWKLALLLLLVQTFDEWVYLRNLLAQRDYTYGPDNFPEETFYYSCLVTVVGKFLFSVLVLSLLTLYGIIFQKAVSTYVSTIWKAVVSSSFGYFLVLPSLIWVDFHREVHLVFVACYTLLSQIQALSVVCFISRPILAVVLAIAAAVDYAASNYLRWWLWFT